MANLITQDLEKLQNLPKHLSKLQRSNRSWVSRGSYALHRTGDYYPWTIAIRIIEAYVGKPFDDAFSYFCTKVPKYQQYRFLEEFEHNGRHWYSDYKIDHNGVIRKIKRDRPVIKYVFYSDDHICVWKHITTGHTLSHEDYYRLQHNQGWWRYRDAKKRPDLTQYRLTTLQGWKREFSSPSDPGYMRLHAERQKRKAKADRLLKKQQEAISYSFLTKEEKEKKKLMEDNDLIRDNHGFDETAFIGKEYHGQKRKWNKTV